MKVDNVTFLFIESGNTQSRETVSSIIEREHTYFIILSKLQRLNFVRGYLDVLFVLMLIH